MTSGNPYTVYMLKCADGTLYTGVTTDVARRVIEHNSSDKGAKYTKTRRPVRCVYSEEAADRSSAQKREHVIKALSRSEKIRLIEKDRR